MLISAQNPVGNFMSSIAFNIGDLVAKYKAAKNKDEEAIAIIDIARHTQEETKQEVVKEIHSHNLTAQTDTMSVKESLSAVKEDLTTVKKDIKELQSSLTAVNADVMTVKEEIRGVQSGLMVANAELKADIEKAKFSAVAWILTGIWLPFILCGGVWFLKH